MGIDSPGPGRSTGPLDYEVLGPLRVIAGGRDHMLTAGKPEILLASLLVRTDQVVPAYQLGVELWGEEPPERASAGLHVYISQLRKFLGGIAPGAGGTIVTCSPGYVLHVGGNRLDLLQLQEAMDAGRVRLRAGDAAGAVTELEKALAFYRGPVLGGTGTGPIMSSFATWMEETRLECLELLIEANLALERHREVIGTLSGLVIEYPLREAYHQLLMLSLYRSGRQADALGVYQRARETIVGELGLEPSRPMRELHQAILLGEKDIELRIAA